MPSEKRRKIIMLDRQPMISLPSEWVKFWKMEKGDIIPIFYRVYNAVEQSLNLVEVLQEGTGNN